ncbi:MAG: DUF4783 domain-containing protein [Bacteroidota bacterium]|nr:DUF4783 domain-containing protein [Bacteroidota bacterium]MDP4214873.1 DUF4783 domain-containing protein [Bacteroidota bacterium]MDP4244735.1 DUF4783 domain-containing protein [Bacteroidota bacterium]MDP4252405.1 DUF4783 domain-containing protein [Bacteroidota bacterium]MDP4257962.1 DUF4783 domain-containing protein [Bacteroidota bacterium]
MKSILGLAVLTLSLVLVSFRPDYYHLYPGHSHTDHSYPANYNLDDVAVAMRSGNAGQLSQYLDTRVDISLPEKSDTYSKSQAEMIIRDFFSTNGVQNFQIRHKGENGGSEYCVGILQTKNGDYRTTLFMKQKGDRQLLQELRFQLAQ